MKSIVTVVLLLFVAASVVYLVVSETRSKPATTDSAPTTAPGIGTGTDRNPGLATQPGLTNERTAPGVVVYYFHGAMRCPTCLKMERYAHEAIEEAFAAGIDAGLIEWRALNYDEPVHEHFVKEYGLTASALVVVSQAHAGADSWRNLDRIWDLVSDEVAFKVYVVEAVNAVLRGES